ncbi:MAG: cyclic nucleotide-binding domain-containing protein [Planctomycetes bacterium]|nr:cyclic nucleotide-binding domain-containing protein [Planctomycetota bacterium]
MANVKQLKAVIPEGTVLFEENEVTKEMYILLAGEVEITKNGQKIATVNTNGSFLGEMATLLNAPRSATVKTTVKSVFLKVLPEEVETLFKVTPELGYKLSAILAQRVADATEKLAKAAAAPSSAARADQPPPLAPQEIEKAKKELEEEKEIPQRDPAETLVFLSRTKVHQEMLRLYFNALGENMAIEKVAENLELPDLICRMVLKEFSSAGLAKVEESSVEFLFHEKLAPGVEEWIFDHGLFRCA